MLRCRVTPQGTIDAKLRMLVFSHLGFGQVVSDDFADYFICGSRLSCLGSHRRRPIEVASCRSPESLSVNPQVFLVFDWISGRRLSSVRHCHAELVVLIAGGICNNDDRRLRHTQPQSKRK